MRCAGSFGLAVFLERAAHVEAELWIRARPFDLDRNGAAAAFPAEQGVDDSQQKRFEAGHRLRDFGVEEQVPLEREALAPDAVDSREFHLRARHTERHVRQLEAAIAEDETASEVGRHLLGALLAGFPPAAIA